MKNKTLFIPLLMLFIFKSLAQNTHEVSFYYGLTDSAFITNKNFDGGASYEPTNSYEFGLKYLRNLSDKLAIETGVNYFKTTVIITPAYAANPVRSEAEPLELVSFPVYANYSFGKYFLNAGLYSIFKMEKAVMTHSQVLVLV
ncbi:MAG TPA: hypothetical protein ENK64_01995 [Flavobacteriales bacterium]|nr:hypothetical protein [Flavobacteriales bacterium]